MVSESGCKPKMAERYYLAEEQKAEKD